MKKHLIFTKGLLAAFVMFGSAMPVLAEPHPQAIGPQSNVIIDWEDEFIQDVNGTQMTTKQKSMTGSKKAMVNPSSTTPVIDWEDEFSYRVPREAMTQNEQVRVNRKNAASWDHEAWQAM